jgi:hypothetical protein
MKMRLTLAGLLAAGSLIGAIPAQAGLLAYHHHNGVGFCDSWWQRNNDASWHNDGCGDVTSSWRNDSSGFNPNDARLYRDIGYQVAIACIHRGEFENANSTNNDKVSSHHWFDNC